MSGEGNTDRICCEDDWSDTRERQRWLDRAASRINEEGDGGAPDRLGTSQHQ